ncbi:hypothetical protein [Nocardia callitridis]|uniref:Uncharacterized protein n=1 Tax=Nocardia callitridis TaxID=648753 RepID=A0ABP9KHK4_9NOCA
MISKKALLAIPSIPALAALAVFTAAGPANAEEGNGGKFATSYAVANGPCVGTVDTYVGGNFYPGMAGFTVATQLYGIGPCTLPITLNWRNLDTGETGSVAKEARGPGYWGSDGRGALFSPGLGRFSATITIGGAHLPDPGTVEFSVKKYEG